MGAGDRNVLERAVLETGVMPSSPAKSLFVEVWGWSASHRASGCSHGRRRSSRPHQTKQALVLRMHANGGQRSTHRVADARRASRPTLAASRPGG